MSLLTLASAIKLSNWLQTDSGMEFRGMDLAVAMRNPQVRSNTNLADAYTAFKTAASPEDSVKARERVVKAKALLEASKALQ